MNLERRDFLKTTAGASIAAALTSPSLTGQEDEEEKLDRQFFELQKYGLESEENRRIVDKYVSGAALPAYSRHDVEPIGVFEPAQIDAEEHDPDQNILFLLIPYNSLDRMVDVRETLPDDKQYRKAASEYMNVPKSNPAYDRIESSLLVGFEGFPTLKVPEQTRNGTSRLFELRTYESHNEERARRKVEMFNREEMELFRSLGFTAVLYGDTLIGDKLPSLTYMLVYDDYQQRKKQWKTFFESDGWEKLSSKERYKNTVSNVHNWFLQPTDYSQL